MSLPIAALFTRSLRVESRQLSLYLARLGLLLLIAVYLLQSAAMARYYGAPGLEFYKDVVYINLVFITLAGLSYFASAITEEKEEMTLGLLRMTRLSPVSILLGKSSSRLVGAVLLLAVQFPFTLLAVTLGGVAPVQVVAAYATLLAYLVFISGLALLCSVVASRTAGAAWLVTLFLLGFFLGPVLGKAILGGMAQREVLDASGILYRKTMFVFEGMQSASPFTRVAQIMRTGFSAFPAGWQVASNVAAGALFFLAAWAGFDLFTRRQKEAAPARGLLAKKTSRFRLLSPGRAWSNALVWKDFNFIAGGRTMMLIKFLVIGLALTGVYLYARAEGNTKLRDYCFGVKYLMAFVLVLEIALYASRAFNEEMKWQTLPSLAILPLSIRSLAYRKVAGCLLGIIPSLTYALLATILSVGVREGPRGREFVTVFFVFFGQAVFFIHLAVYFSLVLKRGGFAVAVGVWFVAGQMSVFLFGFLFSLWRGAYDTVGISNGVIMLLIAAWLHRQIGRRIAKVAASQ